MPATKQKPKTNRKVAEICESLDSYFETMDAVLADYIADAGMVKELEKAGAKLIATVGGIASESYDFKDAVEILESLPDGEIDHNELLTFMEPYEIHDYLVGEGYCVVKLQTIEQRTKLEEFLKTEIYPHYNDHDNISI